MQVCMWGVLSICVCGVCVCVWCVGGMYKCVCMVYISVRYEVYMVCAWCVCDKCAQCVCDVVCVICGVLCIGVVGVVL